MEKTILFLCECSQALNHYPEALDAMRVFIEEGVGTVEHDIRIGILNYGNNASGIDWFTSDTFSINTAFGESCLGASNLYSTLNKVSEYIRNDEHQNWTIIICTYCGPSDNEFILSSESKDILLGCKFAVIYGNELIKVPVLGVPIMLNAVFKTGSETELSRFNEFLISSWSNRVYKSHDVEDSNHQSEIKDISNIDIYS